MQATTIGLDLAKNIFQIHGLDAEGTIVIRKRLGRSGLLAFFSNLPRCVVGIEACATAHYWARELLAIGHQVKLMPPAYVKPYLKRGKNDAADAEAICEAVMRPNDAIRCGEERRATISTHAAPISGSVDPPTHNACECASRPFCRARDHCRARYPKFAEAR